MGTLSLQDARTAKNAFSKQASDISRQLALAGIAVIWLFRVGKPEAGGITYSPLLVWPLGGFCVTLALDLAQYVYAAVAWATFARYHEQHPKVHADTQLSAPRWINWPTNAFFLAKVVTVTVSFGALLLHISRAL